MAAPSGHARAPASGGDAPTPTKGKDAKRKAETPQKVKDDETVIPATASGTLACRYRPQLNLIIDSEVQKMLSDRSGQLKKNVSLRPSGPAPFAPPRFDHT